MLDLGPFLLFFAILIFLFANAFNVIGVSNHEINDVPGVRTNDLKAFYDYSDSQEEFQGPDVPGEEYSRLHLFMG